MADVVPTLAAPSSYRDRKYPSGLVQLEKDLSTSCTLYLGNLSFYTTEEQIHQVFSSVGEVKRIIMGLDRLKKTPCGFCFVEYYVRKDALAAVSFLNQTKVDERVVRCDVDPGFLPDRQYGRGKSGGQVRDEHRDDYDEGRGGWGARQREEEQREASQRDVYGGVNVIPAGSQGYTSYYSKQYNAAAQSKRVRDDEDDVDIDDARRNINPRFHRENHLMLMKPTKKSSTRGLAHTLDELIDTATATHQPTSVSVSEPEAVAGSRKVIDSSSVEANLASAVKDLTALKRLVECGDTSTPTLQPGRMDDVDEGLRLLVKQEVARAVAGLEVWLLERIKSEISSHAANDDHNYGRERGSNVKSDIAVIEDAFYADQKEAEHTFLRDPPPTGIKKKKGRVRWVSDSSSAVPSDSERLKHTIDSTTADITKTDSSSNNRIDSKNTYPDDAITHSPRAPDSSDSTDASDILLQRLREKLEQKARLVKAVERKNKVASQHQSVVISPSKSLLRPTTSFQLKKRAFY